MNLLGTPTASLAAFYKIPPERIVAIHDDLDLDFGTVRAKIGGGEGGHNGLRSMSKSLGAKDYVRVRFGIGRPPGRMDPADYVLSDFSASERKDWISWSIVPQTWSNRSSNTAWNRRRTAITHSDRRGHAAQTVPDNRPFCHVVTRDGRTPSRVVRLAQGRGEATARGQHGGADGDWRRPVR